jgi:hypothetical protein
LFFKGDSDSPNTKTIIQLSHSNKSATFDGSNSALFFNISMSNVEWFVVEDGDLDKIVAETKTTKTTILENNRAIS